MCPEACCLTLTPRVLGLLVGLAIVPYGLAAVGEVAPSVPEGKTIPSESESASTTHRAFGPLSLEGVDWVLHAYRSGDVLVALDDPKGPTRLRLQDGRVWGSGGCNRLMGAYSLAGSKLRFEPPMASTMMACPEPLMSQEQAVHAALAEVASYRVAEERLELLDGEGRLLLRLGELAPLPLTGTLWHLSTYNNGKQAIVSTLAGTEITLELQENGRLGGSDGCNRYLSGFTLEGERLTIGPIATTRMACRGPAGAAEQATAYAAALGMVGAYRIEGDELTLITPEGVTVASFRAKP